MHNEQITIVMVEDDPGHALLIEKNLRRSGITNQLIRFDNGQSALDYFADYSASGEDSEKLLVLLDLNLPQVDGFEVLQKLKTNTKTKKIPVVVLTTTSNPQEIDRCYELGCNICIVKPVDYTKFSEALTKLGMVLSVVKMPQLSEE